MVISTRSLQVTAWNSQRESKGIMHLQMHWTLVYTEPLVVTSEREEVRKKSLWLRISVKRPSPGSPDNWKAFL